MAGLDYMVICRALPRRPPL